MRAEETVLLLLSPRPASAVLALAAPGVPHAVCSHCFCCSALPRDFCIQLVLAIFQKFPQECA